MHTVLIRTSGASWISQDIDSLMNTLSKKYFKMKMRQSFGFLFMHFFNSGISIIDLNAVLDKVSFHMLRKSEIQRLFPLLNLYSVVLTVIKV